jgi:hypothetical protein
MLGVLMQLAGWLLAMATLLVARWVGITVKCAHSYLLAGVLQAIWL